MLSVHQPRVVQDVDVSSRPRDQNAQRFASALSSFPAPQASGMWRPPSAWLLALETVPGAAAPLTCVYREYPVQVAFLPRTWRISTASPRDPGRGSPTAMVSQHMTRALRHRSLVRVKCWHGGAPGRKGPAVPPLPCALGVLWVGGTTWPGGARDGHEGAPRSRWGVPSVLPSIGPRRRGTSGGQPGGGGA